MTAKRPGLVKYITPTPEERELQIQDEVAWFLGWMPPLSPEQLDMIANIMCEAHRRIDTLIEGAHDDYLVQPDVTIDAPEGTT